MSTARRFKKISDNGKYELLVRHFPGDIVQRRRSVGKDLLEKAIETKEYFAKKHKN